MDETIDEKEKKSLMIINTFLFSEKLKKYKNETNKIDKSIAEQLYRTTELIQEFLENAIIEKSEENNFDLIFSSLGTEILRCRSQFHCCCCNQAIKSGTKSFNEHLNSSAHLQKLREYSAKIDREASECQQSNSSSNEENENAEKDHKLMNGLLIEKKQTRKEKKKSKALSKSISAQVNQVKDLSIEENKMPRKMRDFLITTDISSFTNSLIAVGMHIQNSRNHIRICEHLTRRLCHTFPRVKIYTFGSYAIGLGQQETDLDIFIDTESCFYNKLSRRKMKDAIFQTQRTLERSCEWTNFQPVIQARTPILRAFCEIEQIDCDLSFSNGLSVCNTNLISYYINLQPVCKKIVMFIKFWAKKLNLGINSYIITLMTIFYLQQRNIVPSVHELQRRCKPA
jgi:predicted nucleotidyltransferase